MSPTTPFLDKLESGDNTCGLFLFHHYLNENEQSMFLETFNSHVFPWDLNPVLFGERLNQHAYHFQRRNSELKNAALRLLDELCGRIAADFDVQVEDVFCNRFVHATHDLPWHKDTYGSHIFVLSLGAQRSVEWRHNKTRQVESVTPTSGDLYFMPLALNSTHKHRVCAGAEGTRISLVFFCKTPKYAKEYKISFCDQVKGYFASVMENVPF